MADEVSDPAARPRVAAGALFVDGQGRVLLVRPTYKPSWEIPGGMVERGESPAKACRREIREELGLDRMPRGLLCVDWVTDDEEGDKLLFVFDGGPLGDDEQRIVLDGDELDRWAWVHVDDVKGLVRPRLGRRITTVLRDGAGPYLEHGWITAART